MNYEQQRNTCDGRRFCRNVVITGFWQLALSNERMRRISILWLWLNGRFEASFTLVKEAM